MKTLFTFILLFIGLPVFAQQTEGTIEFQEVMQLKINLPEGIKMDNPMPNTRTTSKLLYFTPTESIYINGKKEESENDFSSHNASVVINFNEADNKFYKNTETNTKVEQQEFFGKIFLIEDKLKNFAWKLTGKQKKILDYVCQEATYTTDEDTVSAWFTPQIPVSNGPESYGELPGMILEISKNEGDFLIIATNVLSEVSTEKLVAPSKGKVVTQEKFDKIKEEKTAEMKKMQGGSGNVFIIKEIRN